MTSNRAPYSPLIDDHGFQQQPSPYPPPKGVGDPSQQAYSPSQGGFDSQRAQPQPYPQQGESYDQQFTSPQQGYTQQGYPLEHQQPAPAYTQATIFVTGDPALLDATPFVPTCILIVYCLHTAFLILIKLKPTAHNS